MKRYPKFLTMLIAAVVIASVVFACVGCIDLDDPAEEVVAEAATKLERIPDVSELSFPENLNTDIVGMYFFPNNDECYNIVTEADKVNIDPNKPTLVYTHGMKYDLGYRRRSGISDLGDWSDYNIVAFEWGPYSDTLNFDEIENGEWSTDVPIRYGYADENGDRAEAFDTDPKFCVAEIYGIYYNYLVTHYNLGTDIVFAGHSMGGQLTAAVAYYLLTAMKAGALPKKYMPNRFFMLDPFLSEWTVRRENVSWTGERIGSSGAMTIKVAKALYEYGIPLCYILTGLVNTTIGNLSVPMELATAQVVVDSSFLKGNLIENGADMHQLAIDWFYTSIDYNMYDKSTGFTNYALGAATPYFYLMDMMGGTYRMEKNLTEELLDDEHLQYSTTKKAKVNGFAFTDLNGNGEYDESYAERRAGIKVFLYSGETLIAETKTNAGGYYSIEIPEAYKDAKLTVKVYAVTGSVAGKSDTGNKVINGTSAEITRTNVNESVLVNFSVVEEYPEGMSDLTVYGIVGVSLLISLTLVIVFVAISRADARKRRNKSIN